MALDTRDKRSSAIGLTLPWRGMLPLPDATFNQADRQHIVWLYRGILASSVVIDTDPDVIWTYPSGRSNTISVVDTGRTWTYPTRSNTLTATDV